MNETMTPIGQHTLPPLPYAYDALEPIISERTLRIHHDKHHQGYVDGLNKAELALQNARNTGDYSNVKCLEKSLAFNGSGHILHSVYWTVMTMAGAGGSPGRVTTHHIISAFGGMEQFEAQFKSATLNVEGSGWGLLVWQPAWHRLVILQAEKHHNMAQWGGVPVLVCDVWEHAYYLDYQNKRKEYIDKWWGIIDWNEVERRLTMAMSGQLPLVRPYG